MMRFTRSRQATRSRRCREWGKTARPAEVKIDPGIDMKTPPKIQVDTMPAGKYFAYAAELLKVNPPHLTDEPIVARMKRIGIEPGKSFDLKKRRRRSGKRSRACRRLPNNSWNGSLRRSRASSIIGR